ncbi:MAG: S41 family peptidase [Bdellovibrionales bacterium]
MKLKLCVAGFVMSLLLVGANIYHYKTQEESPTCQNVRQVVKMLYDRHVESLNSSQDFEHYYAQLLDRGVIQLLHRLDPLRILFSSEEVQGLTAKNRTPLGEWLNIIRPAIPFCHNLFRSEKLKKLLPNLETQWKGFRWDSSEKLMSDYMQFLENPSRWPKDRFERSGLIQGAFASALEEAKENEVEESAAFRLAQRLFRRKLEDLQMTTEEMFSSIILKSIVASMDAHSRFFSMQEYNDAIRSLMSTFVGIGVIVAEVEDGFKIVELIEGGPAASEGILKVGDTITKVEQYSIAGERREELAKLLAGPSGSEVGLTLRSSNKERQVVVRRGPVRTANSTIKYEIAKIDGKKLGRIKLDHFYTDDSGEKSASHDFAAAIQTLMAQGAEGLIVDLRDNGGGVLSEVVNIAGLFIDSGPIAFEYGTLNTGLNSYEDTDGISAYKGSLVVLVNENSASAAEILAGTLKTYRRAVIVGSDQTYGKGTIQEIGPIENIWSDSPIHGAVKLTVGYYYLPDGQSVQFDGVKPHIKISAMSENPDLERKLPMALARPVNIGLEFKPYIPWLPESQFNNMVTYLKADHQAQQWINPELKTAQVDGALLKAYGALSGMVTYFRLHLPGLLAAQLDDQ